MALPHGLVRALPWGGGTSQPCSSFWGGGGGFRHLIMGQGDRSGGCAR